MTVSNDPKAPALSLDTEERELIRSLIMADPELVLSDDMVMRALLGAYHSDAVQPRMHGVEFKARCHNCDGKLIVGAAIGYDVRERSGE